RLHSLHTLFPYTPLFRSLSHHVLHSRKEILHHVRDRQAPHRPIQHIFYGRYHTFAPRVFSARWRPHQNTPANPVSPHYRTAEHLDRKSTRLNSSHVKISY